MEKEKKTKTKDYSINNKHQKYLKGISKAFYIIATIFRVFTIIGLVCVVIFMFMVPFLTSNIKTSNNGDQNILKVFDQEYFYKRTENSFEMYDNENENIISIATNENDIEPINKMFEYLEKNDLTKANIFIEIELLLVVALLVIEIIILKKIHLFFKNIHDKSTPFIIDNIDILKKVVKLSVYSLIISALISLISAFVLSSSFSINITNILEILFILVLVYIFEYGYNIQNDTDGKIYSEE